MGIKNNPEQFIEDLDKRIKEIDSEIKWLKADTRLTVAGRAKLNALEGEITKINKLDQLSPSRKDGISPSERRDAKKLGREIKKYESRLADIKVSLGIDEFAKPPVCQPVAYTPSPNTSVEVKDSQIYVTGLDAQGNKTTQNVGRVPTQEEKKQALENIDAGTGTAEDYKTVGLGLIDHMVTKNTHASPQQAKILKYGAVAAGVVMLYKWLKSGDGLFSLEGMAKLGAIYAGTTMATGMNPLEFANSIINGGKYPLLGIDDVEGKDGSKSEVKRAMDSSQMGDYLINGFRDPAMIAKYIKPATGANISPSAVTFDMRQFLQDISMDGQPVDDFTNLKSPLDKNKIMKLFAPYKGNGETVTPEGLMSLLRAFAKSGQEDLLNNTLSEHFKNIGNGQSAADLLANPQSLKEQSKAFAQELKKNAKVNADYIMNKPEFAGYSVKDGHEIVILNQMMKIEKEKNPQFSQSPSTYIPTNNMDYVLLQQRLIASGDITKIKLADIPEARAKFITDIKELLLKNPGLIETSQQLKFAEAFTRIKEKYDADNSYGLELRIQNNILWIQGAGVKLACSGSSESTFNIDFSKAGTNVTGTANSGLSLFEDKIAFAMAACVLSGKTAGSILPRADKDASKDYLDWPFKPTSKSIEVIDGKGWFKQSFFGGVDFKIVDSIMKNLETKTGSHGLARNALCALLNGMKYTKGQNAGKSIWMINNGELPQELRAIDESGRESIQFGYGGINNIVVASDPTLKAAVSSFFGDVADIGGSFYDKILKSSAKQVYGDVTSAISQIYGDAVKGTRKIYEDVKSGAKLMLVDLQNGGSKLLFATITQIGNDMVTSLIDISGYTGKELYQKILTPLYKEIKLQAPKLLEDAESAARAMYESLKKGGRAVESDMKSWLKGSGKDRYQNYIKEAVKRLCKDGSLALDFIGQDLGSKLMGMGKWTIQSVFEILGIADDQYWKFNAEHEGMSAVLTGIIANAFGAQDGPSILSGVAALIIGMVR